MSIELMLNAVNINLVAYSAFHRAVAGQVFALFIITIAAAEVGVGLAIVLLNYGWIIPVIPAVSFFLILCFGKRMPRKGSKLGILAVGSAFVLSCVAAY